MEIKIGDNNWYHIEKISPSYGQLNAQCIDSTLGMWLAVDHNRYRHLILPLADIKDAIIDKKSRGIMVEGRILIINDMKERLYLDIACVDREGYNVFNIVISEILEKINAKLNITEAVTTTINRWRRFWTSGPKRFLTDEQVNGLFGELWFLLIWLLPNGLDYCNGWYGPTGARHDFQFDSFSVEVKTTSSIRGHIHRINGLEQLDPPEEGSLYIYSLRLRKDELAYNSLPLLIQKISELLLDKPILLEEFKVRLFQVGYFEEYDELYSEYKFRIIDERLYIVDKRFPRLSLNHIQGGLPNGIEDLNYEVNLEVCPQNVICIKPNLWNPINM